MNFRESMEPVGSINQNNLAFINRISPYVDELEQEGVFLLSKRSQGPHYRSAWLNDLKDSKLRVQNLVNLYTYIYPHIYIFTYIYTSRCLSAITYLEANNLLPVTHSAFRKGHFTDTLLLRLLSDMSASCVWSIGSLLMGPCSLRPGSCRVPYWVLFSISPIPLSLAPSSTHAVLDQLHAEDAQAYLPCLASNAAGDIRVMSLAMDAMAAWMSSYRLQLNSSKPHSFGLTPGCNSPS